MPTAHLEHKLQVNSTCRQTCPAAARGSMASPHPYAIGLRARAEQGFLRLEILLEMGPCFWRGREAPTATLPLNFRKGKEQTASSPPQCYVPLLTNHQDPLIQQLLISQTWSLQQSSKSSSSSKNDGQAGDKSGVQRLVWRCGGEEGEQWAPRTTAAPYNCQLCKNRDMGTTGTCTLDAAPAHTSGQRQSS